ncbi:MAG: hypothetical protein UHD09_06210 [Bifidobacterium sp.]|nr:hypothetical protein [Bifidobacterium sp.]
MPPIAQEGVPYVLHHQRPNQKICEEDILEAHRDPSAHCRLG